MTETYLNAKSFMAQHRAKSAEIISAEKQLEIYGSLLELGRITQTDYMEAQNEVLRLRTELREIEAKILNCFYTLDNGIESA
ncbi:MAG: TolC family protein [Ruminococcus sp.]|nr:TolC family protein [Ruminococcus sp.]